MKQTNNIDNISFNEKLTVKNKRTDKIKNYEKAHEKKLNRQLKKFGLSLGKEQ